MIQKFVFSVVSGLGVAESSRFFAVLTFFLEDTIKIIGLMLIMMTLMTLLRLHLPTRRIQAFLQNKLFGIAHLLGASLGAITPFCSCSSLPLFFTFLQSGISPGVAFSFLTTSPLVNEVALILLWSFFGFKFMLFWLGSAVLIGVLFGMFFDIFNLQRFLNPNFVLEKAIDKKSKLLNEKFSKRLQFAFKKGLSLTKKILPFVLAGIAIGAFIHGFVPQNFFVERISGDSPWAVPIAVILAVPLYANASGVIPIVQSLVAKGIPLGTALAFMMATVGLSFPEAMILKSAMTWRLLAIFFGGVALAIIGIGFWGNYLF